MDQHHHPDPIPSPVSSIDHRNGPVASTNITNPSQPADSLNVAPSPIPTSPISTPAPSTRPPSIHILDNRRISNLVRRTWHRLRDRSSTDESTINTNNALPSAYSSSTMPSSKNSNSNSGPGQVSHRLRNFFRINSASADKDQEKEKEKEKERDRTTSSNDGDASASASGPTRPFRTTRFFSNTVGRLRSHTIASEGNQLQEAMSPTANANPYFAHQGLPGLRHHNEGSVPPSPPDTPMFKISGPDGTTAGDNATPETKEELARRLRRVASAPNAQGLFKAAESGKHPDMPTGYRPATAELGKDPLIQDLINPGSLSMVDGNSEGAKRLNEDTLGELKVPNQGAAFRRTYSSNSIKVRTVEVTPASFDKVKLIGKGDVGKVYLVREKKSNRLYAMKGNTATQPAYLYASH